MQNNHSGHFSPMQVSPVETLDLEEIACRTVSVSFAVINKFGVSRESPPLILTVPGGLYDIYRVLVVIVYICKKEAVGNLAVQGTGQPMTATNRFRIARSFCF